MTKSSKISTGCLSRVELPPVDISEGKVIPQVQVRQVLREAKRVLLYASRKIPFKNPSCRRAMVTVVGLLSGLRIAEIVNIKWNDIDLSVNPPRLHVRHGKGDKSRSVMIPEKLLSFFRWYRNWLARVYQGKSEYVFVSVFGRITKRTGQNCVYDFLESCGVTDHSAHDLRHTFASALYRSSEQDIQLVQWELGHEELTTTCIYIGMIGECVVNALDRMHGKTL